MGSRFEEHLNSTHIDGTSQWDLHLKKFSMRSLSEELPHGTHI